MIKLSCLAAILLFLAPGNVFAKNNDLNSAETQTFIKHGLSYAVKLYGSEQISVNRVILKHTDTYARTQLTDEHKGIFTIFLTRNPGEYSFYGQLAHEVAHLLNAKLYDAYVEGLNGVFAEKLLKRTGKDWSGWESFYRQGGDPFYAATYFMMKEVDLAAGPTAMRSFLSYAAYSDTRRERMHIAIDRWLAALPDEKEAQIRKIILKHSRNVMRSMNSVDQLSAFQLPR